MAVYLSFVNFASFGDEGDVFGNLLAVLCGIADDARARRIVHALGRARVGEPYPVRVVCTPIPERSRLWRPYMARHGQNFPWQYHNGGIWPMVGGFWVAALAHVDERDAAALAQLARANALGGMRGQSWNAAAFLIACHALGRAAPFRLDPRPAAMRSPGAA